MKKLILLSLIIGVLSIKNASAQPRSIGLRAGLINQELSFQQYIGKNETSFLQIDLGSFFFKGMQATVTYNFISGHNNGFSGFGGFGASFGYSFKDNLWYPDFLNKDSKNYQKNLGKTYWFDRYFFVGIAGVAGIEYQFYKIPLALSLDYRPFIGIDVTVKGDKWQYKTDAEGKPIPSGGEGKYEHESSQKRLKYHAPGLFGVALSCRYMF